MNYIYLIKCEQYYKIGVAQDFENRMAQLATGNPFILIPIACFGFPNAEAVEKVVHQTFSSKRHRGEWFLLSHQDVFHFTHICRILNGQEVLDFNQDPIGYEEAEEIQEFGDSIENVSLLVNNPDYRAELRRNPANGELRGILWRQRDRDRKMVLYIGKRHPDFSEIKRIAGVE